MPRQAHPRSTGSAGMQASLAGVIIFEVAARLGFVIVREPLFRLSGNADNESWFAAFLWFRASSFFLLEMLVGWAIYQLLRKTGHFTLGLAVILPALVGFVVGAKIGTLFFGMFTERAEVTALAGMIGWGAAGATFWTLVHDGRGSLSSPRHR